jgi:hypothetical protein
MFSTSEQFSRAARDLFDTELAALTNFIHATLDVGVHAVELNVDTVKSALASGTVLTRQWWIGGCGKDWLTPVPSTAHIGQLELTALPDNVCAAE